MEILNIAMLLVNGLIEIDVGNMLEEITERLGDSEDGQTKAETS